MAKNMMESVSDEELLSAFIPGDTAHTLIKEYSSLYNLRPGKPGKDNGSQIPGNLDCCYFLFPLFKRQDAGRIMGSIP